MHRIRARHAELGLPVLETEGNGRPTGDNKVKMCYLKRITERGEFKKAEFEIAVLDPRFN